MHARSRRSSGLSSLWLAVIPKALIQMVTEAARTYTACTFPYHLIKHFCTKRILCLVDRNNLGRQTLRESQKYRLPDDGRRFNELYGIQQLQGPTIDQNAKGVVTTIQRLFSMLEGKDMTASDVARLKI